MNERKAKKPPSQAQKFKDAAAASGADLDAERWEERLRKISKAKPVQETK